MIQPNLFDPYLIPLLRTPHNFQIAEVFLKGDKECLQRIAFLFKYNGDLESINRFENIEGKIYRLPVTTYSKNRIINEYPLGEKAHSLSASTAAHLEIKIIEDFDLVSPAEYSHSHRIAYEDEYRDYLDNGLLSSYIAIPIFIQGRPGILRAMNKRTVDNKEGTIGGDTIDFIKKTAKEISSEFTYNSRSIFPVRIPIIRESKKDKKLIKDISLNWEGKSPTHGTICKIAGRACHSTQPILITGETGTGKTLLARTIGLYSDWDSKSDSSQHGHYIDVINTASIAPTLFESEFFGHIKGAFTDATQDRIGCLDLDKNILNEKNLKSLLVSKNTLLDGNKNQIKWTKTLILDELEITLENQAKLLRAIDEKKIRIVGTNKDKDIDNTRVIATTNKDINDTSLVRQDFKNRFPIHIHIPPLRERKQDIEILIDHFLKRKINELNIDIKTDNKFIDTLKAYKLPNNTRELFDIIDACIEYNKSEEKKLKLTFDMLPHYVREYYEIDFKEAGSSVHDTVVLSEFETESATSTNEVKAFKVPELEFIKIIIGLDEKDWNITQAAKIIGVHRLKLTRKLARKDFQQILRKTLVRKKLNEYGVNINKVEQEFKINYS